MCSIIAHNLFPTTEDLLTLREKTSWSGAGRLTISISMHYDSATMGCVLCAFIFLFSPAGNCLLPYRLYFNDICNLFALNFCGQK